MRIKILLVFAWFSGTFTYDLRADDVTATQKKLELENMVNTQISNELGEILPKKTYAVITSVELTAHRVQEINAGETAEKTFATKQEMPVLPGFDDPQDAHLEPVKETRVSYHMVSQYQLSQVALQVVFDQGLPKINVDSAKGIIIRRVRASFGDKATVSFSEARFVPQITVWDQVLGAVLKLKEHFLEILAGIFLLSLIAFVFQRLNALKHKKTGMNHPLMNAEMLYNHGPQHKALPNNPVIDALPGEAPKQLAAKSAVLELGEPDSVDHRFDQIMDSLLREIAVDPLISRAFLLNLSEDRARALLSSLQDSPFRARFVRLIGRNSGVDNQLTQLDKEQATQTMTAIHADFLRFRKLMALECQQRLGILNLLTAEDLVQFVQGKSIQTMTVVCQYLNPDLLKKVFASLSKSVTKELFIQISENRIIDDHAMDEIEAQVNHFVARISRQAFLSTQNAVRLAEALCEHASNDPTLIKEMVGTTPEFRKKFGQYLMTFDDILAQDEQTLMPFLTDLDNQELTYLLACMPEQKRIRLMGYLTPEHQKIITALMLSKHGNGHDSTHVKLQSTLLASFRKNHLKSNLGEINI